ncbi:hypothetical protein SARC_17353 [Sphaeroforma arctica JP610]|uniref:Uncharacterized protein n=1 Tax=Sphaeroforma arctica JP610 TaxID=667725 RepID=A0A0L0F0I7_9EUKA|nr:hypothetical protein SARC_17353 [Sphaeroforma arctica JP610]KNC70124.1 hypothetical protein SARC_17353 [Sphaeroforma arctica JP610]|eukprot:XP_014144026.1 hypothetical protein SARC_17353 [Sphaeroforma arctica JP610]
MNPSNSSGPSYYQNNAIIASNTSINTIDSNYGSPNYHGATTQASTNAGPRSNESMDNTHRLDNVQIASEADKDWAEGRPYLNSGNIMRTPEYAEADVSSPDNRNISSDVR